MSYKTVTNTFCARIATTWEEYSVEEMKNLRIQNVTFIPTPVFPDEGIKIQFRPFILKFNASLICVVFKLPNMSLLFA